ncbi:MAG: hypothetical protein AAGA20_22885 [Planctomycetota bacterium]
MTHLDLVALGVQLGDLSAHSLYMGCAVVGGAVLSIQLLLLLIGGDGLAFFSIRTLASFLTFFGLIGLYGLQENWSPALTAGAALGSGIGMMVFVAWLFSLQSKLHQEGNLDPSAAVGGTATVYLRVPGAGEGKGKITVAIQGRTAEYAAITSGPELPTGSDVRVTRMVNETTFEVERA